MKYESMNNEIARNMDKMGHDVNCEYITGG